VPVSQIHTEHNVTNTDDTSIDDSNHSDDDFEDEFSSDDDEEEIFDPLSSYNAMMTTFNDKAFTYGINPVSEAYAYIMPEAVRQSVANFIYNLQFPTRKVSKLIR